MSATDHDPDFSNNDQDASATIQATLNSQTMMTDEEAKQKSARWSYVNEIHIKNFKAIEECTLPIDRVNILVGPNGSGKSSVLQALHWATRAASYILPKNGKEVVRFERLDYVPSSEPLRTAFQGELQTNQKSNPTLVEFRYKNESGDIDFSRIQIWGARNKSGISVHIEGGARVSPFKQRENFITAYIPGLAGLAENESILAQPLLRRKAASGDAGGVLRNILLNISSSESGISNKISDPGRLFLLNELISRIYPEFNIYVRFDDREDFNIDAGYIDPSNNMERPLETAATGILQIVQIFSYLTLFRPKLLLIDEPDAHLHPNKQELLIRALEDAAEQYDTQVILTTHSPNVVRAASSSTKIIWMDQGKMKTNDDQKVRTLMGWGGLEKKIILFSEDEDDRAIRAILKQWSHIEQNVSVCRTFGVDALPRSNLVRGLFEDIEINRSAIVLRDRDFMTDDEVAKWKRPYKAAGATGICTAGSDIEAYFCNAEYVSNLYNIELDRAEKIVSDALSSLTNCKDKYMNKRKQIIQSMYALGGSPNSQDLWNQAGGKSANTVLGKEWHKAIANRAQSDGLNSHLISNFSIPNTFEVASDIKSAIEELLS